MSTAEPTGIHGGAANPVTIPAVLVDDTDTESGVVDLNLLEEALEYEALPRPLLGSYLIG